MGEEGVIAYVGNFHVFLQEKQGRRPTVRTQPRDSTGTGQDPSGPLSVLITLEVIYLVVKVLSFLL